MVRRVCERAEVTEGLAAYARRQAAIRRNMALSFTARWKDMDKTLEAGMDFVQSREDSELSVETPPVE